MTRSKFMTVEEVFSKETNTSRINDILGYDLHDLYTIIYRLELYRTHLTEKDAATLKNYAERLNELADAIYGQLPEEDNPF